MDKKDIKILLVDDDEMILKSLETIFIANGFEVITANDGDIGLVKAIDQKPNLIITDLEMKETDGIILFDKIRLSGLWGREVPIILLTNFDVDAEILKHISNNQPAIHLSKSMINPKQILDKALELLESNYFKNEL